MNPRSVVVAAAQQGSYDRFHFVRAGDWLLCSGQIGAGFFANVKDR